MAMVTTTSTSEDHPLLRRQTAPPLTKPPLTTTFTASAGCLSDIYLYEIIMGGGLYASLGPPELSDCFPQGWRPDLTARFSPGVCPSGYTVACSTAVTIEDFSETTATCCPSGYSCFSDAALFYGEACSSAIASPTIISVQSFTKSTFLPTTWFARPGCDGGGDGVNAYGVGILWQSTDFYGISPPPAPTTTMLVSTVTSSCLSGGPANTGVDNAGGLTASDKVSIGVGLGVGIPSLLLAISSIWYARRSYKLKKKNRRINSNSISLRGAAGTTTNNNLTAEAKSVSATKANSGESG